MSDPREAAERRGHRPGAARPHRRRRRHAGLRVRRGHASARRIAASTQALAGHPHAIHYALKANSSLSLVRLLRELGAAADANSGGEIEVALRAGLIPDQIVFTGVGKTGEELDRAVTLGLKAINAESPGELDRIAARARAQGTTARVALRVNPDIDAKSHPHISTGLRTNKFGMPLEQARHIYREHARQAGLEPVGVHVHVGSQITTVDPLRHAAERVVSLARSLRDDGIVARARGHRRRPRDLVRRHAGADGGRLRRGGDARGPRLGVDAAGRARPPAGGPRRRAADARRRPQEHTRAGRDSRCSTPACRSCCARRSTAPTTASSRWRRGRDAGALRGRRTHLREQRHLRPRSAAAAARSRTTCSRARHRRVRIGDGLALQPSPAAARSARGPRRLARDPATADRRRSVAVRSSDECECE